MRDPNRLSRNALRVKIEGGSGTMSVLKKRSWDDNQFMSCSDKICAWNVLGLQGSLLSHFLEPIYLDSIVLANTFCFKNIIRALHGRLNVNFDYSTLHKLQKIKVAQVSLLEFKTHKYAMNWIEGEDGIEVISYDTGKLEGGGLSRICKRKFFKNFTHLLKKDVPNLASMCSLSPVFSVPKVYRDAKNSATDYQRAKTRVIQSFMEQRFGFWIHAPIEVDLFTLTVNKLFILSKKN